MNKNTICPSHQQALDFGRDDPHRQLPDSDREKCRTLLTQMLIEVVQLEFTRENEHD